MTADTHLPFSLEEYRSRLNGVRAGMNERQIDILLVTTPENITYLSGFHTTGYHIFQCLIVPADGEPAFVLRSGEMAGLPAHSWLQKGFPLGEGGDPAGTVAGAIREMGYGGSRIGYESDGFFLSPAVVARLTETLAPFTLVPTSGTVEGCRVIKSAAEIDYIRQATRLAEQGILAAVAAGSRAETDSDIAAALQWELTRLGNEYTGSPPFVASGPESALSHATHNRRPLHTGDVVWFEIGGSIHRYHGAAGRTASVDEVQDRAQAGFDATVQALEAMIATMKPGVPVGDVDAAGRKPVREAGFGDLWKHRAAYGMGISFPPGLGEGHIMDIKPNDSRLLAAGMAFHLIPLLHLPGIGTVGCTETVVVTQTGAESLVSLPREILMINRSVRGEELVASTGGKQ